MVERSHLEPETIRSHAVNRVVESMRGSAGMYNLFSNIAGVLGYKLDFRLY